MNKVPQDLLNDKDLLKDFSFFLDYNKRNFILEKQIPRDIL